MECVKMAKLTKSQIIEGLKKIGGIIEANAEIQAEIDYVVEEFIENDRNITMGDLKPVVKNVENFTKKGFMQLLAEAEGKPMNIDNKEVQHKEKKTLVPINKEEKVENSTKKIIAPKKEDKKGEVIKEDKKEDKKEVAPKETKKNDNKVVANSKELAVSFPPTIESESLKATLVARPDLKTISDVAKSFNDEVDFVIATYWTKRHLKQFAESYDPMNINPGRPKQFENDLDLIEVTFANDLVVTGCSLYSYVPQILLPKDFEIDPENNLRYANGVEFEVYEVVAND